MISIIQGNTRGSTEFSGNLHRMCSSSVSMEVVDATLMESVQQLLTNSTDVFLNASKIIITLATNILDNPANPKYRKLRVGNATVQRHLLPVSGALECLFEMGFEEVCNLRSWVTWVFTLFIMPFFLRQLINNRRPL